MSNDQDEVGLDWLDELVRNEVQKSEYQNVDRKRLGRLVVKDLKRAIPSPRRYYVEVQGLPARLNKTSIRRIGESFIPIGIVVALHILETQPGAQLLEALAQDCNYKENIAHIFLMLDDQKRVQIIRHWMALYPAQNALKCLLSFNDSEFAKWAEEDEFVIPDQLFFFEELPDGFPESAKKCVFCRKRYKVGELLYGTDCNTLHSVHERCEMRADRPEGILDRVCVCNNGGYHSREELVQEHVRFCYERLAGL